ncbi:MAG: hypothetical protein EBS05_26315, partial [Proteobacteria bacterium]|nr:hypothetical protein [Pseudomonadota bacterium]
MGALGRQVAGIRMGISFLGAVVALFVAGPLAPHVRTVLGAVGFKDPVTVWMLAAPLAFLGVTLIFNSIAVTAYLKIGSYYKHRAPDDVRMRFERVEGQLGMCIGLLSAVVYLIAGSAYVYHLGYVTKQIESPSDNPIWLKLVNKMREDLTSTSFDRVAAAVTTPSPKLYQTADLIGLLYHNKELQGRLQDYPLFVSLTEAADVMTLVTNESFAVLLPAQTNATLILKDPTTDQLLAHPEIQRVLNELDMDDLTAFLKEGVSKKYSTEPMIGKWQIDLAGTVKQFARGNAKAAGVNEQRRLQAILRLKAFDYRLVTTPDQKVFVKTAQKGGIPSFTAVLSAPFALP